MARLGIPIPARLDNQGAPLNRLEIHDYNQGAP
jgi:hypothetical protein